MIVESLINAVMQIILFSVIPFCWWLILARKKCSFLVWLGFQKPNIENKANYWTWFLVILALLVIPINIIIYFFVDESLLASNRFVGLGFSAVIPALIYAILQTGLSEELFFRGFLTKRLVSKLGFYKGNVLQSLLFGAIHGLMFLSSIQLIGVVFIFIATSLAGYLMGWINENLSKGSIISSWGIHSSANILAAFMAMFNVI
ncbi:CPBP family intramembrane glutamic endopeptidase [Lysinibacillus sp. NPDC093712]|uniref:CPBP family intramembrane glutamic endopeptidase n=1 Tax=Lysinibacillus sp. NPDC093712 TaxID=3390579 RepID=UPI003CFCE849